MHGLCLATVVALSSWFFNDNWLSSYRHGWFDNMFWQMNHA